MEAVGRHCTRSAVSRVGQMFRSIHFDFLDTYIPTSQATRITR